MDPVQNGAFVVLDEVSAGSLEGFTGRFVGVESVFGRIGLNIAVGPFLVAAQLGRDLRTRDVGFEFFGVFGEMDFAGDDWVEPAAYYCPNA